jgi:excisionase family DNA binding protein
MLSIGQAARLLGVTPITARRWTEAGLLPCVRTPGGHRRIAREDVKELSRAIGDSNQAAVRKAREGELETLVAASIAVAAELDQEALLPEIAKHVTVLCRCNTCSISSYSAEDETVTVLADYDSRGRREPTAGRWDLHDYPATLELMHEQVPAVFNLDDRRIDAAERAQLVHDRAQSNLIVPLVYRGRSMGMLEVQDARRSRTYSRQELRLVSALAGHAAVALHNAELFRAATSVDAAMRTLHQRMAGVAQGVRAVSEPAGAAGAGAPAEAAGAAGAGEPAGVAGQPDPLAVIATVLRESFDALTVTVALDDAVVAAATAPAGASAVASRSRAAHVLTSAAGTPRGRLTITVVMPAAASEGESDLLETTTAFAALLSTYAGGPLATRLPE